VWRDRALYALQVLTIRAHNHQEPLRPVACRVAGLHFNFWCCRSSYREFQTFSEYQHDCGLGHGQNGLKEYLAPRAAKETRHAEPGASAAIVPTGAAWPRDLRRRGEEQDGGSQLDGQPRGFGPAEAESEAPVGPRSRGATCKSLPPSLIVLDRGGYRSTRGPHETAKTIARRSVRRGQVSLMPRRKSCSPRSQTRYALHPWQRLCR
jgi:hypothetical protein